MKDVNMEWFAKVDLTSYAQKYIAIIDKKIVASGENPDEVYNKAKEKYPDEEIILWKVLGNDALILAVIGGSK